MAIKLKTGDIIFLDTAPFIYFFEENKDYFRLLGNFFDQLYETRAQAITSIITYIELTSLPARLGNYQMVRKYRDYLSNSQNLSLFPLNSDIADDVVELRAKYNFETPDAIQIGTAKACGADCIITNDREWQRFAEIPIILIGEL